MKATYKSEYKTEKGVLMYVYTVNGTTDELAAYKAQKAIELGRPCSEDDVSGLPLYHTTFIDLNTIVLEQSPKGKFYATGCAKLKLLRDKKSALVAQGAKESEIIRLEDRILDRELDLVSDRPAKGKVVVNEPDATLDVI